METTIATTLALDVSFADFVDELAAALERRGLEFVVTDGLVVFGDGVVGRRLPTSDHHRIVFEWRAADWDPEDVLEVELTADADGVRVVCRRFGKQFWSAEDLVGWFADNAVAPWLAALVPERFGDWLTDRAARRPHGVRARRDYQDPTHHRPSFGAILAALKLGPDDVLLEIGSGGGAFLEQALRSGCSAKAIDHSAEMVRAARELNTAAIEEGRLEVVQGRGEELPFADDSCTCAAMMQVFFFLEPEPVLADCRRVVRPGGRLAVFTVSEAAKGTPAAPEPMASRGRFYTDDELVALARAAGFPDAVVQHPDLEPFAREAGLPDDVVELFKGASDANQLLLAR